MPRPRPSPSPVFPPVSAVSDLPKSQARFSVRPVLEVAAEGGPKRALQATIFFFLRWEVEKDKNSGRLALEVAVEGGPGGSTSYYFLFSPLGGGER